MPFADRMRELPSYMLQARMAATYHGSKVEYHGPCWATLDWENIVDFPDGARYVVFTDKGILRNVRPESITMEGEF